MGQESQFRRLAGARKSKNSPPIMSQEFVIQNHGDIFSCIIVLIFAGFMFQRLESKDQESAQGPRTDAYSSLLAATSSITNMFVAPQYNQTDEVTFKVFYENGPKDLATVFFYMICAIVAHAVIQEYILDKLQRKLHLSKTKTSKFTESGHLVLFALYSIAHAGWVINQERYLPEISSLWTGYPDQHRQMTFFHKLFFLCQLGYWLHQFPEFYFQKSKRDEIKYRTSYTIMYLLFIGGAYALNFTRVALAILLFHYLCELVFHFCRMAHFAEKPSIAQPGFKFWNVLFVITRLGCITLSFLTFWYGLRTNETPYVDFQTGNFNTTFVRLNCLLTVCAMQAYLMWNFIMFHLRQMRERTAATRVSGKTPSAHSQRQKQRQKERKEQRKLEEEVRNLPEADQDSVRVLRSRKAAKA